MDPDVTPLQAYNSIDYLIIGHAARDLTPKGAQLGGTVTYAGLTANALDQRVGVVTSAADQLDLARVLYARDVLDSNRSQGGRTDQRNEQ